MPKSKFFFPIPSDDADRFALLSEVKHKLPEPEVISGMRHVDRQVLPTNLPNKKNERGETQNVARVGGTGKRDETLVGSFEKGIDIREMPPKVLKKDTEVYLFGGFGRAAIFEELEYSFWVYDVYENDESSRNELQKSDRDVLEDAAISDNGSAKSKPATRQDYLKVLVDRINQDGWNREMCHAWFDSIEHSLPKKRISDYITAAIKKQKASGCVEWSKETTVSSTIKSEYPRIHILNTTDAQGGNQPRFLRTITAMMQGYINSGGKTQEYALWNSQCESHSALDESHLAAEKIMDDFVKLTQKFVAMIALSDNKPCVPTKVYYQKIGGNHKVGTIVDYPATDKN